MITYKKALEILKKGKIKLKNEKILSKNSSLRISAENIYSPENYPSSDNTALDGFAVNSKDTNQIKNINGLQHFHVPLLFLMIQLLKSLKIAHFPTTIYSFF